MVMDGYGWIWIEIGARDQIGDGIIEFWVDAESEIFDFRGLDDRTSIEHLSKIDRRHELSPA